MFEQSAMAYADRPGGGRGTRAASMCRTHAKRVGFTLLELLIVIGIIAILASLSLPAIRGLGKANLTAAANRQILDDLSHARLRAINERSTVYMVFVPTNLFNWMATEQPKSKELRYMTNLIPAQYAGYALVSSRTVGDQPGQPHPHYLTEWRTLPEGMIFAPFKYYTNGIPASILQDEYRRPFQYRPFIPFPRTRSQPRDQTFQLPYIAFNPEGQLVGQRDELIAMVRASIFFPRNSDGTYRREPADVQLTPPKSDPYDTNDVQFVRVNWLTGRARPEMPEFK